MVFLSQCPQLTYPRSKMAMTVVRLCVHMLEIWSFSSQFHVRQVSTVLGELCCRSCTSESCMMSLTHLHKWVSTTLWYMRSHTTFTLAVCWKVVILPQLSSSCTPLAQVPFDWPQQDDLDSCHDSSIRFFGPMPIVGNQAIYNTVAG